MAEGPEIITFASADHMAEKMADVIEGKLASACAQNGRAVFAVSGGSTPRALHNALSKRPLPWGQVDTVLVDERWVAPSDEGSNERFVKETLVQRQAATVQVHSLYREDLPFSEAAGSVGKAVSALGDIDVLHLGMGLDGHTASWFPEAEGLNQALLTGEPIVSIKAKQSDVTGVLTDRMTMTLQAVASAKFIVLMVTGAQKRAVLERALIDGPVEALPVRAILRARPDMWVCAAP